MGLDAFTPQRALEVGEKATAEVRAFPDAPDQPIQLTPHER